MDEPSPSYYAIIPASVRYSENLSPNAKLLYGEVTSLCQVKGYCWASNAYFAKLYDVKVWSVSMWIKELTGGGFLTAVIDKEGGNVRNLYLTEAYPIVKNHNSSCEKSHDPIVKNHIHNTTREEEQLNGASADMFPGLSKEDKRLLKKSIPFVELFDNEELAPLLSYQGFGEAWRVFVAERKERGKALTSRAAKAILKTASIRPDQAAQALTLTVKKFWLSFEWDWIDKLNNPRQQPNGLSRISDYSQPVPQTYDMETRRAQRTRRTNEEPNILT